MSKRSVTIDLRPWAYSESPRVLIEHPDRRTGLALAAAIRRAGCTVGVCQGPGAAADRAMRCPLHQLEPCVAVEGADLVVTALDLEEEDCRDVLRGLRTRYPSTPVVVVATDAERERLAELLDDCTVVSVHAAPEQIAASVLDALANDGRLTATRARRSAQAPA